MQNNFRIPDAMFEVQSVMSSIDNEEPSPFIELTSTSGSMDSLKFIIGEFSLADKLYDNGDGKLQFSISFLDKTKEENDKLIALHIDTIHKIVYNMIEDIANKLSETTEV